MQAFVVTSHDEAEQDNQWIVDFSTHFFPQLHFISVTYSAFLFLFVFPFSFPPQHLRKQKLQVLTKRSTRVRTMVRRKARTSRLWYWYQVSSWACTLRCSAPLFLMVNSIQNTASSRGLIGLSWWILDSHKAFSLYLRMGAKIGINVRIFIFILNPYFVLTIMLIYIKKSELVGMFLKTQILNRKANIWGERGRNWFCNFFLTLRLVLIGPTYYIRPQLFYGMSSIFLLYY